MDSVIEASLIAAGSTVVVAVAGYVTSMRSTIKTVEAGRSDRIWDRQAVAYEEILADVTARRVRRDHVISTVRLDSATEAELQARIKPSEDNRWYVFEGRVHVIASSLVLSAFREARRAHLEVMAKVQCKLDAADENRVHKEVEPGRPAVPQRNWRAEQADPERGRSCRCCG